MIKIALHLFRPPPSLSGIRFWYYHTHTHTHRPFSTSWQFSLFGMFSDHHSPPLTDLFSFSKSVFDSSKPSHTHPTPKNKTAISFLYLFIYQQLNVQFKQFKYLTLSIFIPCYIIHVNSVHAAIDSFLIGMYLFLNPMKQEGCMVSNNDHISTTECPILMVQVSNSIYIHSLFRSTR